MKAVGNWHPFKHTTKYFVVASAATGAVLANISIARNEGIKISMIVPGPRNDVFVGTPGGLRRIYV